MHKINTTIFNYLVIFIICLLFCSEIVSSKDDSFCLQKRSNSKSFDQCKQTTDVFCSNIQCEPVEDCESTFGNNREIVKNVTGRGCCPACVEYLDEDQNCEVGAILKKCRNGLFCDPATKQCNLPPVKNRCLIEYHNRQLVQKNKMIFYAEAEANEKNKASFFEIKYATDIEFPVCDHETGKYELKQCRKSKCFCVNPDDGKYTFGLTEDWRAENVTCECANFFQQKLVSGKAGSDPTKLDFENTQHYSQIHSKCDSSGNFERLQCINSTCFCVDEKTGKPEFERAAIYGALSTLPCFSEEKSKKLGTKEADANYLDTCEKQLLKTKSISMHFYKKGTKLRGLDAITCQFNGEFNAKQCQPNVCNCVDPQGTQMKSYGADRAGGKDTQMECKCAREENYATKDKLAFNQLQCDGFGNFNAFQCFEGGRECYCVDEDGSRISEVEPSDCLDRFIKEKDGRLSKDEICRGMRRTLTDRPMTLGKYYKFDRPTTYFIEIDEKPKDLFCDNSGQCKCAYS